MMHQWPMGCVVVNGWMAVIAKWSGWRMSHYTMAKFLNYASNHKILFHGRLQ